MLRRNCDTVYEKNNHRFIAKDPCLVVQYRGCVRSPHRALRKGINAMRYDFSRMGENIAALRRAAGLTQELLADRLGVTSQAVSKWESGQSYPDITILPQLALVLNCSVADFFASGESDT